MNRTLRIVLAVLVVVAVGAGAFYGGMVYGKGQAQAALPGPGGVAGMPPGLAQGDSPPSGQAGLGSGQSGGGQGGMLRGEIQEISDRVLTITDQSGNQTQVQVTDTTLIQKQASVTLADLQQGETVMVSGSQGSDGSITARLVQVTSADTQAGRSAGSGSTP